MLDGFPSEVTELKRLSHGSASDLISSAEVLLANGRHRLAFVAAVFALEEIGKSVLLSMNFIAKYSGRPGVPTDDHVKKLFWAVWSPSFGRQQITGQQLATLEGMAQALHESRIRALYAPESVENLYDPLTEVPVEEAENVVGMARARLGLEESWEPGVLDDEQQQVLQWFLHASDDPTERQWIFNRESMVKLVDLGNAKEWMRWLWERHRETELEAQRLLEEELNRPEPDPGQERLPKWRLKARIYSESHSLRPAALLAFNARFRDIRLHPVEKRHAKLAGRSKSEAVVEIVLPRLVPLERAYSAASSMLRWLLLSLNVGVLGGLFWIHFPDHVRSLFDDCVDVDLDTSVRIEISPALIVDWGKDAFTQEHITRVAMCFGGLPRLFGHGGHPVMDSYLAGVAAFSKIDVLFRVEATAYHQFFRCLMEAMEHIGDWDGKASFGDAFHAFVGQIVPDTDEVGRLLRLGTAMDELGSPGEAVSMDHVIKMKILVDSYLFMACRDLFERMASHGRIQSQEGASPASGEAPDGS